MSATKKKKLRKSKAAKKAQKTEVDRLTDVLEKRRKKVEVAEDAVAKAEKDLKAAKRRAKG